MPQTERSWEPRQRSFAIDADVLHRALSFGAGGWKGPFPGQTKWVAYAFSILSSPVFVNRRRCFGPLPQRMYAVQEGFRFKPCAWNRRIRSSRESRVRLQLITASSRGGPSSPSR